MASTRRRKNLYIDQRRLDRLRTLLGAETETDTIDRALVIAEDMAEFEAKVVRGLKGMVGRGGFANRFAPRGTSE